MDEKKETSIVVVEKTATIMRPLVAPDDLIRHHQEITELVTKALVAGTDYGKVPGAGDRDTLLKPGAERLAVAFGCTIEYDIVQSEIDHDRPVRWSKRKKLWNNKFAGDRSFVEQEISGESLGLYRYVVRASLRNRQSGEIVGSGLGSCSSMEGKYVDRPRDLENTVLKIAQKRALVASVLNTYGLSNRFTQDVEDMDIEPSSPPPRKKTPPPTPKQQNGKPAATPTSGPVTDLWKQAETAGIPRDIFQTTVRSIGITRNPESQTASHLAELEDWIKNWDLACNPETGEVEEPPAREPGEEG